MKKRIIAFLLLTLMVCALALTACNNEQQIDQPPENVDNETTYIQGDRMILAMSRPRALRSGQEVDIATASANGQLVQEVTATITPAEATNSAVDWSVAFKNPASTWAAGKNVSEYVIVNSISENTLTIQLKCLKAFGEQIILTCTSQENAEIKATATVDYYKRLTNTVVRVPVYNTHPAQYALTLDGGYYYYQDYENATPSVWNWVAVNDLNNDIQNWSKVDSSTGGVNSTAQFSETFSDGTINNPVTSRKVSVQITSGLWQAMVTAGLVTGPYTGQSVNFDGSTNAKSLSQGALFFSAANVTYRGGSEGLFSCCSEAVSEGVDRIVSAKFNKLIAALKSCPVDFYISVNSTLQNGTNVIKFFPVNVADSSLKILVESLTLSTGSIKF